MSEDTGLSFVCGSGLFIQQLPVLVLNAFRAHPTDDLRKDLLEIYTAGSLISGGYTRYVQPLYIALNKPLKDLIKAAAERHYDVHEEEWEAGKVIISG